MYTPSGTGSTLYWVDTGTGTGYAKTDAQVREIRVPVPVKDLERGKSYDLPDGAKLEIDAQGNYTVLDDAAKVVYKANRIREFNVYLSASDLLEDFIRDMGKEGVLQSELLQLPVNCFIHWLILQAAIKDGDSTEDCVPPQKFLPKKKDRCKCCGRFLPRVQLVADIHFCNGSHLNRYLERRALVGLGGLC
jgi:hypothetical protein